MTTRFMTAAISTHSLTYAPKIEVVAIVISEPATTENSRFFDIHFNFLGTFRFFTFRFFRYFPTLSPFAILGNRPPSNLSQPMHCVYLA